jgi:hypothetical protein
MTVEGRLRLRVPGQLGNCQRGEPNGLRLSKQNDPPNSRPLLIVLISVRRDVRVLAEQATPPRGDDGFES